MQIIGTNFTERGNRREITTKPLSLNSPADVRNASAAIVGKSAALNIGDDSSSDWEDIQIGADGAAGPPVENPAEPSARDALAVQRGLVKKRAGRGGQGASYI